MDKKGRLGVLIGICLITFIFCLMQINAEILLSQPKTMYNLGDTLSVDIKINSIKTGYLDVNLVCNDTSKNLYHNVPDSLTLTINRLLTQDYISDLYGNCYIDSSYASEDKISQSFVISKYIEVTLQVDNMTYVAGSSFQIKGTAIKDNNLLAGQGYSTSIIVNLILPDNSTIKSEDIVKDGQFNVNFSLPETLRASRYALEISVVEKDSNGNEMNRGYAQASVTVTQKPARIDLAMDLTSIIPGESLNLVPIIYDMAGDEMNDKILIKVVGVDSKTYYEGYIDSGSNFTLETETNYAPGYAKITLQKDEIILEKAFEIQQMKKIKSEINNRTMVITNIGNVPYNEVVELNIGSEKILKEVNLAVGEKMELYLTAPEGTYDVSLKDSTDTFTQPGVSLTGAAIGANQASGNVFSNYPIAWVFIAVVIILLIYIYLRRYFSDRRMHFHEYRKDIISGADFAKRKGAVKVITPEKVKKNIDNIVLQGDVRKAQHEMVLHGKNQQAGIVALKIKSGLSGIEETSVNKAMEYAYALKGVSYVSGDYVLLIFTPLLTGNSKNEETAIKAAMDIDGFLKDHNRKFRGNVIDYGIGVNAGEIVNIVEKGVIKFASINRTINVAKKIAEASSQEVILSKEIHEKTMGNIKADKAEDVHGVEGFRVKRVVDTQASQKFINEFMRRQ